MPRALPRELCFLEAEQVATAFERRWRDGLATVAGGRLQAGAAREIRALVARLRRMSPQDVRPPRARAEVRRGRKLASEIAGALALLAQLRGLPKLAAAIARVRAAHPAREESCAAVAAALDTWALLGERHRARLDGFAGFDVARLAEARSLAKALRALPSARRFELAARARAYAERDALAAELDTLVRDIRAAARFVYRDRPEVVREFTSEHGRRTRKERRAAVVGRPAPPSA